jgi:hypothetical protein
LGIDEVLSEEKGKGDEMKSNVSRRKFFAAVAAGAVGSGIAAPARPTGSE